MHFIVTRGSNPCEPKQMQNRPLISPQFWEFDRPDAKASPCEYAIPMLVVVPRNGTLLCKQL